VTDYRQLQRDALAAAQGDRVEATLLIEDALVSADANADPHAGHILEAARRKGLRHHLDVYCRTSHGRLLLVTFGVSVPAGKAVHRRTQDGAVTQLHLPFLDMTFDEIRDKIHELVGQREFLYRSIVAAARLLELEGHVPDVRTPRAVLRRLGVDVLDWLKEARAI
jgi:hypothetical protein